MKRPECKDKKANEYIDFLEAKLATPYAETFIILSQMAAEGNKKLKESQTDFTEAIKVSAQLKGIYEQMAYYKAMMSPEEMMAAEKAVKNSVSKEDGVEEYLRNGHAKTK